MVTIKLRVPADRERTALVEILAKSPMTVRGIACASADAGLAKRHGNAGCDPLRPWGHPPLGRYRFVASGRLPNGSHAEFGDHMLVFQPESGPALEAESFGRLLLPVYAGAAAKDGRLRRTQGGVRVAQALLGGLLYSVATDPDIVLEISVLQPPAWWQFWRYAEKSLPLAGEPLAYSAPPLDEISLAQALASGKRFAPGKSSGRSDDDFLSSRDSDRSFSSTSSSDTPYSGRGGESGGGGASGSWEAPASSRSGGGVDSAGRIIAAAAGVAAAVVVAETLAATESDGASPDAGADTGTDAATNY
jgi:uncharacterized membrane protein YgcG